MLGEHRVILARREPDGLTLARLTTETVPHDEVSAPTSGMPQSDAPIPSVAVAQADVIDHVSTTPLSPFLLYS